MRTEVKYNPALPYSLHDRRINKIEMTDDRIILMFEEGYVKIADSYENVKGKIIFERVDFGFVAVTLLSIPGNYGTFLGERLDLADFLEAYGENSFEVIDELYGYNQVQYSGQLWVDGRNSFIEMQLSIYFEGNMVYETEEGTFI